MKLKVLFASLACASVMLADIIVSPKALPQNAQNFLNTYFKGINIAYVKQDVGSFDVHLVDGTELEFLVNGEWMEVDGKYKAIPTGFLPANLVQKVKATQLNAEIFQVDKKVHGYKFKFNNMMKVYTDKSGNVIGQKFD